jgi:transposase
MGVLRAVFDADERRGAAEKISAARDLQRTARYMVRAGWPWRMLPHDLPPWQAIGQQTLRWMAAGIFSRTWRRTCGASCG